MVVSAILTTALAPITGALFGASYGTAIRIGYEIIFPALFGDVINEQKNNPTKLQEEGTKRTIESMHKMFTGVGGAAAMEFGIEQGIEMAKKKTESPDVQNMIDSSLGLTNRQLNLRGKSAQFQDPIKDEEVFTDVEEFKFTGDAGDFHNQSNLIITKFFKKFTRREPFDNAFKLLVKEKGNTSFTRNIWKLRPAVTDTEKVIKEKTTKGSVVRNISLMYNTIEKTLKNAFKSKRMAGSSHPGTKSAGIKNLKAQLKHALVLMKAFNRFVQSNRHVNLTLDTTKSLKAFRPVAKK